MQWHLTTKSSNNHDTDLKQRPNNTQITYKQRLNNFIQHVENVYRQGFEQKQGATANLNGQGWMRVFIFYKMIMAPGVFFTRQYVIQLVNEKFQEEGFADTTINQKTAGKILDDIWHSMKNNRTYAVRPGTERIGKTKVPVSGYRLTRIE